MLPFEENELLPFEEAEQASSSLVDQIPGMEPGKPVPKPPARKKTTGAEYAMDAVFGIPEALLGTIYNIGISGLGAPLAAIGAVTNQSTMEEQYKQIMDEAAYTPKTQLGQRIVEKVVDPAITQLLGPLGPMTFGASSSRPKPIKGRSPDVPQTKLEGLVKDVEATRPDVPPEQMELPFETSAQQVAEMRARELGQRDMFAPVNEPLQARVPEADMSPMNPVRPMDTTGQAELFDQSTGGRVANPYEAALGDWRIDENGIPVKVDLSMEAQNLQNPLQRNLWGDELPPTMSPVGQGLQGVADMSTQMGKPLTQAIDEMPWAQRRGAINKELRGGIESTGALDAAMLEATPEFKVPKDQRGAVDTKIFDEAFEKIKDLGNYLLRIKGNGDETAEVRVYDKQDLTKPVAITKFSSTNWITPETGNIKADWVQVTDEHRGKNLSAEMYKFIAEQGSDVVPSKAQTGGGRGIWQSMERSGVSQGMRIPRSQRGAIDLGSTEPKSNNPISQYTPDSPEILAARKSIDLDNKRSAAAGIAGLSGYRSFIDTPEKAIVATVEWGRDLTPSQLARGKTVTPGANAMAIVTNHPLVRYVRDKMRPVFLETERLTHEYITGPTGITKTLNKLSQQERNEVVSALMLGSDKRQYISSEALRKNGFNENQIKFIEQFYAMDKEKLRIWNESRAKVGMEPVEDLPGHVPGMFKGDYKQLVFGKNKDGSRKVISVIAVDSTYQLKVAQEAIKKQYPDATFSTIDRRSLGGNGNKADMFSGMGDVLRLLEQNDPAFADVRALVDAAVKQNADALYGAAFHSLQKKGITGSEGRKIWLDRNENTNAFLKAYLQHWEEGILSHKNMPVEAELKAVLDNPQLQPFSNAKQYVNAYINNATGRNLGTIGDALNKILDAPFELAGFGPSLPREAVNQINKRVGQHLMGWGNYMFTAVQFLQVPQMAWPEAMHIAKLAGISEAKAMADFQLSLRRVPDIIREAMTGDSNLDSFWKQAVKEAQDRGLMVFSEYQEVNRATQSKFSRGYDKAVDFNRELAEKTTRPQVFFGMLEVLKDSGVPKNELFDVAYSATQRAMIDYRNAERPMMYSRLGVVGQLAGSLSTFKHGQLSQYGHFMMNAVKKGDVTPLVGATSMMLVLAGVTGTPFYQELDDLYGYLTDKFGGGRKTIRESLLKDFPEWVKSGMLSEATNVNLQSRLSAANVVPDSLLETMPYMGPITELGEGIYDFAKNPDELSASNLAMTLTPSGPLKGLMEAQVKRSPEGIPIDRKGMLGNPRTPWESQVKTATGGLALSEALRNEKQYSQMMRDMTNRQAQTKIMEKAKRAYITGNMTEEQTQKFMKDYIARKGDPNQFMQSLIQYAQTTPLTKQQRLQGIPSGTLSSLYKYQNYND
jgi:hypothetical protein